MATKRTPSFDSHNPATGEVAGTYPIMNAKQVSEIVGHARNASVQWQKLGFGGRKKVLLAWSTLIIKRIDQIAALVSLETGKPVGDAKLEVSIAVAISAGQHVMQKRLCALLIVHQDYFYLICQQRCNAPLLELLALLAHGTTRSSRQWVLLLTR